MSLLPFSLVQPARLDGDLEALGSRYCALAGHLAAHLKFRDGGDGQPVSLFVTSLAEDVEGLHGSAGDVAGVDVELWHEGGLFFAMARHD